MSWDIQSDDRSHCSVCVCWSAVLSLMDVVQMKVEFTVDAQFVPGAQYRSSSLLTGNSRSCHSFTGQQKFTASVQSFGIHAHIPSLKLSAKVAVSHRLATTFSIVVQRERERESNLSSKSPQLQHTRSAAFPQINAQRFPETQATNFSVQRRAHAAAAAYDEPRGLLLLFSSDVSKWCYGRRRRWNALPGRQPTREPTEREGGCQVVVVVMLSGREQMN